MATCHIAVVAKKLREDRQHREISIGTSQVQHPLSILWFAFLSSAYLESVLEAGVCLFDPKHRPSPSPAPNEEG